MECPHCEEELHCPDYYGRGIPGTEDFQKIGDIYKCRNEECEAYQEYFHTDEDERLHEGYPC